MALARRSPMWSTGLSAGRRAASKFSHATIPIPSPNHEPQLNERNMAEYIKKAPSQKAEDMTAVEETARRMLADIKENGDAAVARYASELDKWQGGEFRVTEDQIAAAEAWLPETFKEDFEFCHRQITQFAQRQLETLTEFECETEPGILLGQKQIPVSNVGCYIPGGKYPLVAAASMSVGVARAAGVEHIIGCAPPR
ncbi:MAG TPA: hypothetical protein EYM34_01465, partial [Alphaproteobacteria bacterium]|nr:hypothetical protein [Alphaproteobacteria bacterium]